MITCYLAILVELCLYISFLKFIIYFSYKFLLYFKLKLLFICRVFTVVFFLYNITKNKVVLYQWIGREANKVADKLATHRSLNDDSYRFYYYVPCFITNLLHEDYVNSSVH